MTVERELEKVLHKFSGYGQLCERGLEELIDYTGGLKHEILQSHGKAARVVARDWAHPPRAPRAQPSLTCDSPDTGLPACPCLLLITPDPGPGRVTFLSPQPGLPRTQHSSFAAAIARTPSPEHSRPS